MGTESHTGLIEAIQRFLDDATGARQRILEAIEPSSPRGAVHAMAALPTCVEVNALARKASLAAGYLLPEPAGRPLDADALFSTGLFRMLIQPSDADLPAVARDLAGYLADPPVDIWDYVLIDAIGALQDPIPVVDGWELVTPSADELRMLLPLPSTAFDQDRPFDPDDYGELAMLRRVNRDAGPQKGIAVPLDFLESLDVGHPERQLWQPLIALSLYDHPLALKLYDHPIALSLDGNPILRVWAWYRIEPRRRTDKLFEAVPRTPDGETDIERLLTGAFDLELAPMLRFLEELSPLLTAALSTQAENKAEKKAKEKAADQLRRCAEHFLTASDAHREGKVSPLQNADAVLHYAIALEVLLGDDDHSDLTRKVSQRAAVLAGANDDHRLTIEQLVRDAYSARSAYAHGGKRDKIAKVDLAKLRRVVCRCILTRLILGDPTRLILGDPIRAARLHELADRALLSHDELQSQIRHPFEEFAQRYQASLFDCTRDI
jgi:Apea-like HEPN